MPLQRFEEIEGVVRSIGDKALWFRESDGAHEISIPLSCIENAAAVEVGDNYISVSESFLRKLGREGRR